MEAAWGDGGGEPDIPQWLRYGEADVHDALSSNSKLRPDQVRICAPMCNPARGACNQTAPHVSAADLMRAHHDMRTQKGW